MNAAPGRSGHWGSFLFGLLAGEAALLALRVAYYRGLDIPSQMGPEMAFFFSPHLYLFLLLLCVPSEFLLRRVWYAPIASWEAGAIGFGFPTALFFWALPGIEFVELVVNPITIRWFILRARPPNR